jgi:hypothetical protein
MRLKMNKNIPERLYFCIYMRKHCASPLSNVSVLLCADVWLYGIYYIAFFLLNEL